MICCCFFVLVVVPNLWTFFFFFEKEKAAFYTIPHYRPIEKKFNGSLEWNESGCCSLRGM